MTNNQIKIAKDRIDKAKAHLAGDYGFLPPHIYVSIDKIQRLLHGTWLKLDVEEKKNKVKELGGEA